MVYALRMALRQFRLQPAFAAIVVLVLGLGMGAATAVYTIVDSVVLRPLPYRAPDRLVKLWDTNTEKGLARDPFSPVTFMDYKALPVFQDAAAWWRPDVNLREPGLEPVRVKTIETSGNLFAVLGVGTQLGEGFPKDGPFFCAHAASRSSAIACGAARYGADPGVIGRQLDLNDSAVHDRRRDAGEVPFPRRRRRLAAAAVGSRPAQPRGALHGGRRPPRRRRVDRAGAGRRRYAGRPARPAVRRQQQGLGNRARAAAERSARLLPAGALRAVRRCRPAVRHRLPERGVAPADARPHPRAGDRGAHRHRRRASAHHRAAARRERDPLGGGRAGGTAGRPGRAARHRRPDAHPHPPPRRGRSEPARARRWRSRSSPA